MITKFLPMTRHALAAAAALLFAVTGSQAAVPVPTGELEIQLLGRYSTGYYDQGGAEIPAYDAASRRLFVVNLKDRAIDVISIVDPVNPVKVGALDLTTLGQAANSVSVKNGVLAVAVEAFVKTDPGLVAFFDTASLNLLGQVTVGALPDMLTWTANGARVVVANEGEPNADYTIDPEGSVSIIEFNAAAPSASVVREVSFRYWDKAANRANLVAAGVRLFGPNATTAQDLEPEYIAVNDAGTRAWVTLQENNAIASINLDNGKVLWIRALGTKDHMLSGNGLDASDKDNVINIANWPVQGYYMPDAIDKFYVGGKTYLITANEGDARDYAGYAEESRVKSLTLDPVAFPDGAALKADAALGRLNVTKAQGDTDGDGDYDKLYSFGTRSVSVWNDKGALVWDSGDAIEQFVAATYPANFNAGHTTNSRDDRSDNKGPEPEGVKVASLFGQTYAFVGLERIGGVMVWNLASPTAPQFVTYFNPRDFSATPGTPAAGDLGPEGLLVIPAKDSPNGKPLLVVANEVSGTTTVMQINKK